MLQNKIADYGIDSINHPVIKDSKDKELINSINNYITQNITNNINIDDIASYVCMSRSKLFTELKRINGKTPLEIINNIRMSKAIDYLKNYPDMNITDISIGIGFTSARYFSRCFKEFTGTTPMEYRKNSENK